MVMKHMASSWQHACAYARAEFDSGRHTLKLKTKEPFYLNTFELYMKCKWNTSTTCKLPIRASTQLGIGVLLSYHSSCFYSTCASALRVGDMRLRVTGRLRTSFVNSKPATAQNFDQSVNRKQSAIAQTIQSF